MRAKRLVGGLFAAALLVGGPLAAPAHADAPDRADAVEAFRRDVFVVVGSTLRNPTADTAPDAPLFNVAGIGLGVTWGQWSAATAESQAKAVGGRVTETVVRLKLTGLIPGGVYSIFWATIGPDSEHPQCQGVERSLPLIREGRSRGASDPSSFVAESDGTAIYRGTAPGDLLAADQAFFSVIYHADGGSYHPFPNKGEFLTHDDGVGNCRSSYGEDAMRQMLVLQKW